MADAGKVVAVLPFELPLTRVEMPVAVRVVDDVVKIRQTLFAYEIAQDVHVPVGFRVGGENVVVRDDDNFVAIPDLCVLAEFTFEHTDGAGAADVMGHEDVDIDPDVVAGLNGLL